MRDHRMFTYFSIPEELAGARAALARSAIMLDPDQGG
jgi:hypothetical protein